MSNRETGSSGSRPADRRDYPALCRSLSEAFADDPVAIYLFPEEESRRSRLRGFYRTVVSMMARNGAVYTEPGLRAAAVWQAPLPSGGAIEQLTSLLGMIVSLRLSTFRAFELGRIVQEAQIEEPHWYLGLLGTVPAARGKGIASALLRPILERCDADELPAYLESSKPENVPFYERHGFRVTAELQVPDGPKLWAMLRGPQQPGAALG